MLYIDISLPREQNQLGGGQGIYHPVSEYDFISREGKFKSRRLAIGIGNSHATSLDLSFFIFKSKELVQLHIIHQQKENHLHVLQYE